MESNKEIRPYNPLWNELWVCMAYLREKNKCPGCRDTNKTASVVRCKIKNCELFKG